jgi:hypothetical protein
MVQLYYIRSHSLHYPYLLAVFFYMFNYCEISGYGPQNSITFHCRQTPRRMDTQRMCICGRICHKRLGSPKNCAIIWSFSQLLCISTLHFSLQISPSHPKLPTLFFHSFPEIYPHNQTTPPSPLPPTSQFTKMDHKRIWRTYSYIYGGKGLHIHGPFTNQNCAR